MAEGLTDREKFLRRCEALALSTLPISELPIVAAPPAHHDGVMVALSPDEPEKIAVEGEDALPADDLHVTLCYLGKVQDLSSFDQTKILSKARSVVDSAGGPFTATTDGVVVMGKNDDGVPATALLIQSDEIVRLYDAMAEALEYESKYPTFIPHMTAGYGIPVEDVEPRIGDEISFSKVIVKFGDAVHEVPLTAGITAARGASAPNVIDRVIDSLGRMWDEALHPRDNEGKFIKKNGAISGKIAVPSKDRKGVNMVDANRASVVGFHTFDNEVWVLAEVTNPDGTKTQGFARAQDVQAVAPVKARLDALYPVEKDATGDAFLNASLERKRQLDLILVRITSEYGPNNDEDGAFEFLGTLGLRDTDLDYMMDGDDEYLGGIRRVDSSLSDDELEEQEDIINDARLVKELRARVHGLQEDVENGFSAEDAHVQPTQQLLAKDAADPEVVAALNEGVDPLTLETDNLLAAMKASGRFERAAPKTATGVSPIAWLLDSSDETGHDVKLAGLDWSTTERAFFTKESVIGAEFGNTDIVNEVTASLMAEAVRDAVGDDDSRLLKTPKSVFGDNPEWDGKNPPGTGDILDMAKIHQPGHVVSQHGQYLIPPDWEITYVAAEETAFHNDIKGLDEASKRDQTLAFYEDMGEVYGHETAKLILWDFIILNGDRNPGNAILATSPDRSQSAIIPIDHGFSFDEPYTNGSADRSFDWFMNYGLTQGWRNYVQGGLRLDGSDLTEESLRKTVEDFVEIQSNISVEAVLSKFRAIPGVTDEQIERVEESLTGAVDRIAWMRDNINTVLRALTGESDALM